MLKDLLLIQSNQNVSDAIIRIAEIIDDICKVYVSNLFDHKLILNFHITYLIPRCFFNFGTLIAYKYK